MDLHNYVHTVALLALVASTTANTLSIHLEYRSYKVGTSKMLETLNVYAEKIRTNPAEEDRIFLIHESTFGSFAFQA